MGDLQHLTYINRYLVTQGSILEVHSKTHIIMYYPIKYETTERRDLFYADMIRTKDNVKTTGIVIAIKRIKGKNLEVGSRKIILYPKKSCNRKEIFKEPKLYRAMYKLLVETIANYESMYFNIKKTN